MATKKKTTKSTASKTTGRGAAKKKPASQSGKTSSKKSAGKKTTKKAPAKKAVAKKTATKTKTTKPTKATKAKSTKKTVAKKAVPKKVAAKTKKTATKKAPAKKAVAKKAAAKTKAATKKPAKATKAKSTKKTVAKKAAPKGKTTTLAKKTATKKTAKKAVAKKAAAKTKTTTKKTAKTAKAKPAKKTAVAKKKAVATKAAKNSVVKTAKNAEPKSYPPLRGKTAAGKKWTKALTSLAELAQKRLDVPDLREGQDVALEQLLKKKDVLAVMPTGKGKSLLYQLMSLKHKGVTLVISPLLALIKDQVDKMSELGIPVCRADSSLTIRQERAMTEFALAKGGKLMLTTPERVAKPEFREFLKKCAGGVGVTMFVVDEAHCVFHWGNDFRPSYLSIRKALDDLSVGGKRPQVLATTATAPPHVRDDILFQLGIEDAQIVTTSFDRSNLHYEVIPLPGDEEKLRTLVTLLKKLPRPGIVYCATVKMVERLHESLTRHGLPVTMYHGRMGKNARNESQRLFMEKQDIVMIATNAFGLGVDKKNIRNVIHYHVPGSLESYAQEAGRGGRDGKPSRCVLLFSPDDVQIQEYFLKGTYPTRKQVWAVHKALEVWEDDSESPSNIANVALASGVGTQRTRTVLSLLKDEGFVLEQEKNVFVLAPDAPSLDILHKKAKQYEARRIADRQRLDALLEYVAEPECRNVLVLDYLGETGAEECGRCDNCLRSAEAILAASDVAFALERRVTKELDSELGEDQIEKTRVVRTRTIRLDREGETEELVETSLEEDEYEYEEEDYIIERTAADLAEEGFELEDAEITVLARKKQPKPKKTRKRRAAEPQGPSEEALERKRQRRRRRRRRKKVLPGKEAFSSPVIVKEAKPTQSNRRNKNAAPVVEYVRGPLRINTSPVASATPNDKRPRKRKRRRKGNGNGANPDMLQQGPTSFFAEKPQGTPGTGRKKRRRRRRRGKSNSSGDSSAKPTT